MDALVLGLTAAGGLVCAAVVARRRSRYLNFGTLLIVNLVLVAPISGMVHLLHIGRSSRGYFDLDGVVLESLRDAALWACLVGVIAACAGCLHGSARHVRCAGPREGLPPRYWEANPWLIAPEARLLLTCGVALLGFGIVGFARVQEFAALQGQSRIISVDDGLARYAFLSNWLVWVISFALLGLAAIPAFRKPYLLFLGLSAGIVLIATSLAWAGGRSIVLVMVLPVALTLLPLLRGVRFLAVAGGVAALVIYTTALTRARATAQAIETTSWASALDWQWGRYSMLGFAADRVDSHGYMWGETLLAGISNPFKSLLGLLGVEDSDTRSQTVTSVAASYFHLPDNQNHIVPGLLAELFLNFGLVGVAAGCYLLGRITIAVDRKFITSDGPIVALAWAYLGTLLVLRTWNSDSGTIWAFIVFSGAPLVAVAMASKRIRKRRALPRVGRPPVVTSRSRAVGPR